MNNFINDVEKMHDFKCLTKSDFLKSYSYLTEEEYDATKNETHEDSNCPKCKGDLDWDSGSDFESEKWYCLDCGSVFEVQVEMVRFWDTLKEVE